MDKPHSVDPSQARHKSHHGRAILVCAHEDIGRCRDILLEGSVPLYQLEAVLHGRSMDDELIFYCDSPGQQLSQRLADLYRKQGFHGARFLDGGVEAWKKSGFPLAVETPPENPAHA